MTPSTKKRGPSMPPPGGKKPGLTVAIGVGPSKSGPPGDDKPDTPDESTPKPEDGGKVSPEQAVVLRAGEECHMCQNYAPESGECSKVEGYFDPEDRCIKYFTPIPGAKDDEESEEGGMMPPPGGTTEQE
jgi:hypothetical protein